MQKELLNKIRLNRLAYENKIFESIERDIYQCERYHVKFSLAIGACLEDQDMRAFEKMIRVTDTFIMLSENICCVVFGFTDASEGVKAASNMLSVFEAQYFSKKIYLSIINAKDCETPQKQISKLFDVLSFGIDNGMNNIPLADTSF